MPLMTEPVNLKSFHFPWGPLVEILTISSATFLLPEAILAKQPNCANPQTQSELNYCAGQNFQKSDRELNQVYQALLPRLAQPRRQGLITAQLNWIRFRNDECTFFGSYAEGGSMQPMLIAGCKDRLTQQRTADLRAYLHGKTPPAINNSYQSVDQKLNQLYRKLQQNLSPHRQSKLETAELSWIAFRDTTCEFEASHRGNTARYQCMVRTIEQRNRQLTEHLSTSAKTSGSGLFIRNQLSQSSRLGLIPSLKMILKILDWTY
ncbi:lysozyme inhibitor LprI family protein [Leptothermofonsia sp. ETS-13]|uniref:lysozyme inhibitor LprI family protein n=1 Tax=Leptothermofonsia sp. ETS-13 TaxID=3035696 RepID=UPI003BA26F53